MHSAIQSVYTGIYIYFIKCVDCLHVIQLCFLSCSLLFKKENVKPSNSLKWLYNSVSGWPQAFWQSQVQVSLGTPLVGGVVGEQDWPPSRPLPSAVWPWVVGYVGFASLGFLISAEILWRPYDIITMGPIQCLAGEYSISVHSCFCETEVKALFMEEVVFKQGFEEWVGK